MSATLPFKNENEFLDEFYQVMVRHRDWTMTIEPNEIVRVVIPHMTYEDGTDKPCCCPIEAIVRDRNGNAVGSTWLGTSYMFDNQQDRHIVIYAADCSAEYLMNTNIRLPLKLRRLEVHDRLIRMSKEFEYDRSQPKEI